MAARLLDELVDTPVRSGSGSASASASDPSLPEEQDMENPPKQKAHHKIVNSLHRMASTPSLVKRNRARSSPLGSRKTGNGSMSCVSLSSTLSSGQCWTDPNSSKIYGNVSTRALGSRTDGIHDDENTPARIVGALRPSQNGKLATSIPLPSDVRSSSPPGSQLKETVEFEKEEANTADHTGLTEKESTPEKKKIDFWDDMPPEIRMSILRYLSPREMVSCSRVSRAWNAMCFDGQLWASLDATTYYSEIPRDVLVKIIVSAGPFLKSLNLRGCIQLQDAWIAAGERFSDSCRNLVTMNIEDCRIDKSSVNLFLVRNRSLTNLSMRGVTTVTNSAMKILSESCTNLEYLNVSWCKSIDTRGLKRVVKGCRHLRDLRASELSGFDDEDFMRELFEANTLERLVLSRCSSVNDMSLKVLLHGMNPQVDVLTGRPVVPPRKLRHLDLSRCRGLTDAGVKHLAHCVPDLEGLQLSFCPNITDNAVVDVIQTTPLLSHLDLEELEALTNNFLVELSNADCAGNLKHLNISYCERIGDTGMLKILKNSPRIQSLDLDNTRVSDLTIMEICSQMRDRGFGNKSPVTGLRAAVFDCGNVTWAGVREILSNNTFVPRFTNRPATMRQEPAEQSDPRLSTPSLSSDSFEELQVPPNNSTTPTITATENYPNEIVQLKCFYGWQMTVDEHTKRVLRGNLAAATRLERKWADYMMATEEAGVNSAAARRRRRRTRDAEELVTDDDDDDDNWYGPAGLAPLGGRRRRARSGGCVVM